MKPLLSLLVASALTLSARAGQPWSSQTGLSETTLNSRNNTWSGVPYNMEPLCVSGYDVAGEPRFSALWGKPADGMARRLYYSQTSANLTTLNAWMQFAGWRIVWLNGFQSGGVPLYNIIFRYNPGGAEQVLRLGDSLINHQVADGNLAADDFKLDSVCAFLNGNATLYSGWWNKTGFISLAQDVSYNLTGAQYQAEFNANAGSWRLASLSGHVTPQGEDRFTVVWKKPSASTGWVATHGVSEKNYLALQSNQVGTGWRPAFQNAWKSGAEVHYSGTWVPNDGLSGTWTGAIDTMVRDYMDDYDIPGLSVAIMREGRLVYNKAYGYASYEDNEWAGTNHRWRIASVSKPVCAVSVLRSLEDSPNWSLDSNVFGAGNLFGTDYGTLAYSNREKGITVRELLNMTAGWDSQGKLWYNAEPGWGTNHTNIVGYQLDNVDPVWASGTKYKYNNFNYQVAARVPEKISGQSFLSYTKEQVFDRCGMTSMALGGRTAADRKTNEVAYYEGPIWGSPENVHPERMDGSTAWICRPADLMLMARRIDGNSRHADIIGSYALSQMRLASNVPDENDNASGYGLGWYSMSRNGRTWWGHNGAMAGTQAIMQISQTGDLGFAYACNTVTDDSSEDTYSSLFRNRLLDIMDDIDDADAWPSLNLFTPVSPAYDAWAASSFSAADRAQIGLRQAVWAPDADPDIDGIPNSAEMYFGLDPMVANRSPYSVSKSGDNLVIRWTKSTANTEVTMAYRYSSNMATWLAPNVNSPQITDRPDFITFIGSRVQELVFPMNGSSRFIRFEFETH